MSTLAAVRRALVSVLVAVSLGALAAEARGGSVPAPSSQNPFSSFVPSTGAVRSWTRAETTTLCRWNGAYSWPIRPFDRPHPVRGNFGDPRTVYAAHGRSFSFHNGVDIYAPDGNPVYAVASGTVVFAGADEIIVHTADGRSFQYWHVVSAVHAGQRVFARRTLLGTVRPRAGHVHLTEVDNAIVQNPLAPGHLAPYSDRKAPTVRAISFRNETGEPLEADALAGPVSVVVWAQDVPSLPVPGLWRGFPVAPAKLTLAIETVAGAPVVWPQSVFDFTTTTPDPELFWRTYAPGTYQNRPAVGRTLYTRMPGRYLYLAQLPTLEPGSYRIRVTAADVCGNTGSLSLPITVAARTGPPALPAPETVGPALAQPAAPTPAPTAPLPEGTAGSWPRGVTAYTVVLASLPAGDGAGAAAASVASRAVAAALPRVGVLSSSEFTSLAPGYQVVFSGVYGTADAAANAAFEASGRYPGAYPRLIVPHATPPAASPPVERHPQRTSRPRGRYAVLAASVREADGYAAAREEARRALEAGLARARVVHSAAVEGLRPGFYVVLATGFRRGAADAAVARVATQYPTAYVRLLPPRSGVSRAAPVLSRPAATLGRDLTREARTASAASSRRPCPPSPSASRSCTPSSDSARR